MESVKKAQARLGHYPQLVAACGPQASAYGRCVGNLLAEVRKQECQTEFDLFIKCVRDKARKMGTRL